MAGTRLDATEIEALVSEYRRGARVSELAQRYGLHRSPVRAHLRRHEVEARDRVPQVNEGDTFVELYEQGYSLAVIGKQYGMTQNARHAPRHRQRDYTGTAADPGSERPFRSSTLNSRSRSATTGMPKINIALSTGTGERGNPERYRIGPEDADIFCVPGGGLPSGVRSPQYAHAMRVEGEQARVLVTVKATPQPSTSYGDTSCVAGVRIDGDEPTWIRLYPIAFRWLDGEAQFKKYDVIELEVRRKDSDTRRESYSPTQDSWTVIQNLPPWKARHQVIGQLPATTTCELMRAASADGSAPSLGLVYPADVDRLEFEPHPKWTPEQLAKMRTRIDKESSALIPMTGSIPAILKEPEFKVRYRYRCEDKACAGHQGRILDWELTSLQNRLRHRGEDVKAGVTEKFLEQMFAPGRHAGFYMGNFELAARRGKFSVLGVYWPRTEDAAAPAPTLF